MDIHLLPLIFHDRVKCVDDNNITLKIYTYFKLLWFYTLFELSGKD